MSYFSDDTFFILFYFIRLCGYVRIKHPCCKMQPHIFFCLDPNIMCSSVSVSSWGFFLLCCTQNHIPNHHQMCLQQLQKSELIDPVDHDVM